MEKIVNKQEILSIKTVSDFRKICCKYGGQILSDILEIDRKTLMKLNNIKCDQTINITNIIKSSDKSTQNITNLISKIPLLKTSTYDYDKFDYYDKFDNYEYNSAKFKNQELVSILHVSRNDFCSIGTNKIKRRLNKLSQTDDIAKAVRLAIEIEDKSIQAKKYYKDYYNNYDEKENLIYELIDIFEYYKWNYSKQKSDVAPVNWVVFFEIPDCEQISWHTNLNNSNTIPNYKGKWDGKVNSTLDKLEAFIKNKYEQIIY